MLRHTCDFKLANDGVDTRALQHFMGHRKSCTRCAIYRAQLRPLRWVLEGLSPRDQATSPILRSRLLLAGRAARSGSATARPSHLACPFSKPHPRQEPWWFLPNEPLESPSLPEWMKSWKVTAASAPVSRSFNAQ